MNSNRVLTLCCHRNMENMGASYFLKWTKGLWQSHNLLSIKLSSSSNEKPSFPILLCSSVGPCDQILANGMWKEVRYFTNTPWPLKPFLWLSHSLAAIMCNQHLIQWRTLNTCRLANLLYWRYLGLPVTVRKTTTKPLTELRHEWVLNLNGLNCRDQGFITTLAYHTGIVG